MNSLSRGLVGTQHVPICFCCRQAIETSDEGILRCGFCPKSYHRDCLPDNNRPSINTKGPRWGCPSHKCQCDLTTSAMKKGEKMLACVTCPRSYCPKCVGEIYKVVPRTKIWSNMSGRYDSIQCETCMNSGFDLTGFISSDLATEHLPSAEIGSQQANTSLREQIAEKIQKNKLKQEDVAKAINFSAGTLSLYLKGDSRKRGWSNLEEKLASYLQNYESESNSDQFRNDSSISNSRIALPRMIYDTTAYENPPQEELGSFTNELNPDDYMVTESFHGNNNDLIFENDGNDNYPYDGHWPYSDGVATPSNTNLAIPQFSHAKDDTEYNNGSLADGSYSY